MTKRRGDIQFPQEDINTSNTLFLRTDKGEALYHSHDLLCYGDSGGNGLVGKSNVQVVQEEQDGVYISAIHQDLHNQKTIPVVYVGVRYVTLPTYRIDGDLPNAVLIRGMYGSETSWVREDLCMQYIQRLDSYALLDEDHHSALEWETFDKAWEDYYQKDLVKETLEELQKTMFPDREVWALHHDLFALLLTLFLENDEFCSDLVCAITSADHGVEWSGDAPYVHNDKKICLRILHDHGLLQSIEEYRVALEKGKAEYEDSLFS